MRLPEPPWRAYARALQLVPLVLLISAGPGLAATEIFGDDNNPLETMVTFLTGPVAVFAVIAGIVVTGISLVMGGDFSGFGRKGVMITIAGAFVLFATQIVTTLFGTSSTFTLPDTWSVKPWQEESAEGVLPKETGLDGALWRDQD